MAEQKKYDSTVARIAGNIASGMMSGWVPNRVLGHAGPLDPEAVDRMQRIVTHAVAMARAIVAEVQRPAPEQEQE